MAFGGKKYEKGRKRKERERKEKMGSKRVFKNAKYSRRKAKRAS
jgi:hypothetical protein